MAQNLSVCPKCGYHFPIGAYYRLSTILDPGSFRELFEKLPAADPLSFPGYRAQGRGRPAQDRLTEAVVTATGTIGGRKCVVGVLDSRFFMGSMSAAVGEKITLAIEYATKNRLPLILFAASGGARMQEGILSLMQMAKTSAALARFSEKGLLYISVFTDPTTGGVTASFASLGDIILAEPGALIGFAGPRAHPADHRPDPAGGLPAGGVPGRSTALWTRWCRAFRCGTPCPSCCGSMRKGDAHERTADRRPAGGHCPPPQRPNITDYIQALFTDFFEQKGDRLCGEDAAILGGVALYHGRL